VAIKLLAPHLVWEKAFVERFMREARSVAQLRHPNIVDVHDVGQDGGNYYFVMGFCRESHSNSSSPARPLVPRRGAVHPAPAGRRAGLRSRKGLVHRDVKPANVIFDERNQPVLTDFGIAKAAKTRADHDRSFDWDTALYGAEQIQGKDIDGRTDQYALAIIAFELLTGSVPFDAADDDGRPVQTSKRAAAVRDGILP